jgi:hypothetical protein
MIRKTISSANMNKPILWDSVRNRRSSILIAVVAGIFVASMALGFAVRAYSRAGAAIPVATSATTASVLAEPSQPVTVRSQSKDEDFQVKVVTLRPRGFEPEEITVAQKRFVLAIENRSRLDHVDIQLLRQTGNSDKIHEVHMQRGRTNSNDMFELPPGEYVLTEATHPTWTCRITVRPH